MRRFVTALVFSLAITAGSAVVFSADNSLFSDVRVHAVFTPAKGDSVDTSKRPTENSADTPLTKATDAGELSRMLRQAGFEPKEVGSSVVTTKKQAGDWNFPVVLTISDDAEQMGIVLLLSTAKEQQPIPNDKLLGLLEANRKFHPAYFAYSTKHRRFELYRVLKNQQVTSDAIRNEIDRLTQIAQETQDLWNLDSSGSSPKPTQTEPQAKPAGSLVGTWAASRSDQEAFAIQFTADGKFNLVYVNQGKQTKSSGKFTRDGDALTLEGTDGFRLSGTVQAETDKEFRFQLQNSESASASLLFKKASR